jgi:hypothetical protein
MPRPRKADEATKYESVVREMAGRDVSQRRIAESLGISQSTVSRLLATAPLTAGDHIRSVVDARAGYHAVAQARHDAFHAGSERRVVELTAKLAGFESRELFRGGRWSDRAESDELCKFFNHDNDPWS